MGQALYRKYRSKSLAEIVGQEHITKTLDQAVKTQRISHAYLFTGPRGVGKTSIARILAHDINGLSYEDDTPHVDIIEIDAASNRRIDEIRELREKVYIAPVMAKYKVYIIDEVHMLTKEAFNALLKTLEEPPAHVVFILATTDAHKLPETIVSRTQRFQFKPIDAAKIAGHLKEIAEQESIAIDEEALRLIAGHGQGSFRDSISLLDQAANHTSPITADAVNQLLGTPSDHLINELLGRLQETTPAALVTSLNNLFVAGYPAPIISSKLSAKLRAQLIDGQSPIPTPQLLSLLEQLIDVPASADPEHYLEICLIKAQPRTEQPLTAPAVNTKTPITERADTPKPAPPAKPPKPTPKPEQTVQKKQHSPAPGITLTESDWEQVLSLLKSKYNTLYGIVRMAKLESSEPGLIKLQFAFAFHQKRINDTKNREIILNAVEQVTARSYHLECLVDTSLLSQPKRTEQEPDLSTISTIFGGGEMLS